MSYTPHAVRNFHNVKKKLPQSLRDEIDRQVDRICEEPRIGVQKAGDLKNVWVSKFSLLGQQYLLAYTFDEVEKTVIMLATGGHENFYRDLKRYLKA